jgi:myo-inositol 2-dehydrogenase / D-chiro-inositol 1-dehydrogenase
VPDRVRLGVLGLGAVAQAVHLPILERLGDRFEVSAVADLSAELANTVGERARVTPERRFTSLDAMLVSATLDGLLILSSGSHGAAIEAGLDRGLAVFTEKPLAWTLAEADSIAARVGADPKARLQVGYMKLYDPAVEEAVRVIRDVARVGSVRSIEVCVLHPSSESQLEHARLLPPPADVPADAVAALGSEQDRLLAAALGPAASTLGQLYANVVLGSIVHDLALIRAFAGDPIGIDAVDVWPDGEWPPSVGVTGRLDGDARFVVRWHFLPDYPAYREEVRVVTERATLELEFPTPYLLNAPTELRVTERVPTGRRDAVSRSLVEAFDSELVAFHRLVVDGKPPKAGHVEGRADIVTAQRIVARHADALGIPIEIEAPA